MEDVYAPCVEQTPVVGVDGTTYNLENSAAQRALCGSNSA